MPLLRASPEAPREKVVRGGVEVRYSFRDDMRRLVSIIEEAPRIRTLLFRSGYRGFDEEDELAPSSKIKTFRIECPWTYFLYSVGNCSIVFTDHQVRSIDEPSRHAAPLPNTASGDDGINICMGYGVGGGRPKGAIESYKHFWASIFNEEITPDSTLIPEELESKSEYWVDVLVKWRSLTEWTRRKPRGFSPRG